MLSMKAKYALKALVALGKNDGNRMHVKAIAEIANIPHKFLEAILVELKGHGFVMSSRGATGGYVLAVDSNEIRVGDVIRVVDGPLAPIRCASMTAYEPCEDCVNEEQCSLHSVMMEARHALSQVLDKQTIFDLVRFEMKKGKAAKYAKA